MQLSKLSVASDREETTFPDQPLRHASDPMRSADPALQISNRATPEQGEIQEDSCAQCRHSHVHCVGTGQSSRCLQAVRNSRSLCAHCQHSCFGDIIEELKHHEPRQHISVHENCHGVMHKRRHNLASLSNNIYINSVAKDSLIRNLKVNRKTCGVCACHVEECS